MEEKEEKSGDTLSSVTKASAESPLDFSPAPDNFHFRGSE